MCLLVGADHRRRPLGVVGRLYGETVVIIQRVANERAIDNFRSQLGTISMNRFESTAFASAIDGLRALLSARDRLDDLRETIPQVQEEFRTSYKPLTRDQRALYRATSAFFAEFYTAVSGISGVVARFSSTFEVNHSDNGPFLRWAHQKFEIPDNVFEELERARHFRAILAHPQQFPPYEWATITTSRDPLMHVVLYGPFGRGKNPIPAGATTDHPYASQMPDWQFAAPDEVSVTNCVCSMAGILFAEILASRSAKSSFVRPVSRDEALARVVPVEGDFGWDARYSRSWFDADPLPPAAAARPWQ